MYKQTKGAKVKRIQEEVEIIRFLREWILPKSRDECKGYLSL